MKKLLFTILLFTCFSINAAEYEEDTIVIQMANKIFEDTVKGSNFDWTDYSCEQLMDEAYELAHHVISNNLKLEDMEPLRLRQEWMP